MPCALHDPFVSSAQPESSTRVFLTLRVAPHFEVDRATSNVPFVALLRGSQSWERLGDELKWVNAGVGLTIALGLATRRMARRSPDYSLVRR